MLHTQLVTRLHSRTVAAVAVVGVSTLALLAGPLAPGAHAATSTDPSRVGLYGVQDPTFDGAYRQSLALLALDAAGQAPAESAVGWLLRQQCPDGGFEAFREHTAVACAPPSSATFSGEDVNSTGIAAQALHALGKDSEAGAAVDWLGAHQSAGGGWAYYPDGAAGNDPDANSTALALSAYLALGRTPPAIGGTTPYDALLGMQVGCSGAVDERGAYTFFGSANDYATVQAALAVAGGFLPVPHQVPAADAPAPTCPGPAWTKTQAADYAAGYLARRMAANGHTVPDPFNPGQADVGTTANAVIALVAAGHGADEVSAALTALAADQAAFTHKAGADVPGALATLVLADVAGGGDPTAFGGTDLVARLAATLTTAAPTPKPKPTPSTRPTVVPASDPGTGGPELPATGDTRVPALSAAGALLLLVGSGLVLTARRRPERYPRG